MTNEPGKQILKAGPDMSSEIEHRDDAAETQNPVRRKITTAITVARDKSGEIIADTREKSFRAANETNRMFQEHPIAAVAAAAAAGAVLAIFLPKLAIASQAGAAVTKVGNAAKQAARSKVAVNAAQMVLSSVSRGEKATINRAIGRVAKVVTDQLATRRTNKKAD